MKKYIILGHCNNALSMILESIQKLNNKEDEINVNIIHNENDIYDLYYGNPYKPFKRINIKNTPADDFQPLSLMNSTILIASMDTDKRIEIFNYFRTKYNIQHMQYNFIFHPSTIVASTAEIGHGCYFGPNVSIAPFAQIKNFTYINRNASIGHHTVIGQFCTLNPGCNIGGNTVIGSSVTIGIGANVFDNIIIGVNTTIGAGSVVTKNIPSNCIAYGVPAKIIKNKNKNKK